MKKIFCAFVCIFILINCKIAFAYDKAEIANEIQNFQQEIKADSSDMDKVLNDAFDYDPRVAIYYKGYSGKYNSFSSKINIVYSNTDVNINDVYVAYNKDEFKTLLIKSLLYSNDRLCIVTKNIPTSTDISQYINEIRNSCPIAVMGYKGYESSTLDTKVGDYSYFVIKFTYDFDKDTLNSMKKTLEQKACEIVASNIAKDMPPYMKVYLIHNYIINHCSYAENYENNNDLTVYTAYGALVNGKAVCDGYANAAQVLFNLCNIENIKISGKSKGEGHAWNLIKLDNEYYHIDLTWDDPVGPVGLNFLEYDYYNLTDSQIEADHTWDKSAYPKAEGSVYNYKKTTELIRNDKTNYNQGYSSFKSVFSQYPPLTSSENPNKIVETTEVESSNYIEPVSVLDNVNGLKFKLNKEIGYIIYWIYDNVYKVLIALVLFLIVINIFRRR